MVLTERHRRAISASIEEGGKGLEAPICDSIDCKLAWLGVRGVTWWRRASHPVVNCGGIDYTVGLMEWIVVVWAVEGITMIARLCEGEICKDG